MAARSPRGRMRAAPDPPPRTGGGPVPPGWPAGPARARQRPRQAEEPPADDRGHKTCHARHTLLVRAEPGQRCGVRATDAGPAQETSLAARDGARVPPGRGLSHDLGGQGVGLAAVTLIPPQKTPRGGARPPPAHATKRRSAAMRLRMAPAMGGGNRVRIVNAQRRLGTERRRDPVLATCGGGHHCRRPYRPWQYAS